MRCCSKRTSEGDEEYVTKRGTQWRLLRRFDDPAVVKVFFRFVVQSACLGQQPLFIFLLPGFGKSSLEHHGTCEVASQQQDFTQQWSFLKVTVESRSEFHLPFPETSYLLFPSCFTSSLPERIHRAPSRVPDSGICVFFARNMSKIPVRDPYVCSRNVPFEI